MSKVTIEAALSTKLRGLTHPVELCDDSGHFLGHFLPERESARFGPFEPQVSEEELDRREWSNEKSYTTAEVLEYLAGVDHS